MLGAMLGNRKPVPTEKNMESQQAKSGNAKPLKNYDYQEFVDDEEEYDTRILLSIIIMIIIMIIIEEEDYQT